MIFVLDNYDSFTFNLVQRFGEIDATLDIRVERNDRTSIAEIEALRPQRIVISPGPCTPHEAGISRDVIAHFAGRVPVLGVCLGHQCLGDLMGAEVVRADRLMHGKLSEVHHDGRGVFAGLPSPFSATRYHSLIVKEETIPEELEVCAWVDSVEFGREVMGLRHRNQETHGVQFHPESFLTDAGTQLLANFLAL